MDQITLLADKYNCDHAISIKQPWAWLIVNGIKDIENRNWYTSHLGLVFIHAARKFDQEGYDYVERSGLHHFDPSLRFDRGGIVGIAEIAACTKFDDSDWFEGPYGFILHNPQPLPFTPSRGQLGIYNIHHPDINPFTNRRS